MMPIYITLTEYQSGQSVARTIDVNTVTSLETYLIESTHWGTRLELTGHRSMISRETPERIRALAAQATHYA